MTPKQIAVSCPNPFCAAPASLGLCTRFASGFGLQLGQGGTRSARWDDTHCLVCGHFSSPYSGPDRQGSDLRSDANWLQAVDRALVQTVPSGLASFLAARDLGVHDLLAMRHAVQGLRDLDVLAATVPGFPQVGLLRVFAGMDLPDRFGVSHGEAESEPFARKVRVLGRLLGATSAEGSPRYCAGYEPPPSWYFYADDAFIGLLHLEPNRGYRGQLTIDDCLSRLLHTS